MREIVFYWVWSWLRESMLEGLPYRLGMAGRDNKADFKNPAIGNDDF